MPGISVSRLTAPGRGAVAVLRIDAAAQDDAVNIDAHFVAANGMPASQAPVNRILYGHWGEEDVVVVRTDARQWEVNCHGGEVAASRIAGDIRSTTPTRDAEDLSFLAQLESDLLNTLLACRTQQSARYVLAQQQGILARFLTQLAESVDYHEAEDSILECLRWRRFAVHLTAPWQVAIVGQPNAGKSSLLNAIVGFDRSIVFEEPGTTRDIVESEIVIQGWPIRLMDTAGIRQQVSDEIESQGVDSAQSTLRTSDACLLVVDAVTGWTTGDESLLAQIPTDCPTAILLNKMDLPNALALPAEARSQAPASRESQRDIPSIRTSAISGDGLEKVLEWLPRRLIPSEPQQESPLPLTDPVAETLQACIDAASLEPVKANAWRKRRAAKM